jgi:hypothetical protein
MVTTEGYMFFLPLVGSDWETQKLNWKNTESRRQKTVAPGEAWSVGIGGERATFEIR